MDEWLGDGAPLSGGANLLGFFIVSTQSLSVLRCASLMKQNFWDWTLGRVRVDRRFLAPVLETGPVIRIGYVGVEDPHRGFQILMMNGWNKGSHDLCSAIRNDQPNLMKSKRKI